MKSFFDSCCSFEKDRLDKMSGCIAKGDGCVGCQFIAPKNNI